MVITGGGTAGHVYPALALLASWSGPAPAVTWIGSPGGMEQQIVADRGLPFLAVQAAPIRDRSPVATAVNVGRLSVGFGQAVAALRRVRPDVVLATGGYVTVPVAYAAALVRIPTVVFLPDITPGWAVRAQVRVVRRLATAFPEAAASLPADRTVVTGYPLRPALLKPDREGARRRLGLDGEPPVVLLYGGSRGSRTLNEGVAARLEDVLRRCQLVHVAGSLDEPVMRRRAQELPDVLRDRYHLHGFIGDHLVDALAAADLAIARAGASTLAELPAVGLPAILVPGPFSDQATNAAWLADRGAALVLGNDEVAAGRLPGTLLDLLADTARLEEMRQASRRVAVPDAAARLQRVVEDCVSTGR